MDDIFLMICTWSRNEPLLEMPINHDICQLSKKKLTPGVAEPKRALRSSSLTRVQSFVHLFLFEVMVVFQCWFAFASCFRKAWHFLWCCVRPLADKAVNRSRHNIDKKWNKQLRGVEGWWVEGRWSDNFKLMMILKQTKKRLALFVYLFVCLLTSFNSDSDSESWTSDPLICIWYDEICLFLFPSSLLTRHVNQSLAVASI